MKKPYTNLANRFCKIFSGDWTTWPHWANTHCPVCRQEFRFISRILVTEEKIVFHYDCFEGEKPVFTTRLVREDSPYA